MRSKIITTVITALVVGPFAYISAADIVSIKQTRQQQTEHIQQLTVESDKLDTAITKTQEIKEQAVEQVNQLEQQKVDAVNERQKLEAELGAN